MTSAWKRNTSHIIRRYMRLVSLSCCWEWPLASLSECTRSLLPECTAVKSGISGCPMGFGYPKPYVGDCLLLLPSCPGWGEGDMLIECSCLLPELLLL
jgi:hypothetical protein